MPVRERNQPTTAWASGRTPFGDCPIALAPSARRKLASMNPAYVSDIRKSVQENGPKGFESKCPDESRYPEGGEASVSASRLCATSPPGCPGTRQGAGRTSRLGSPCRAHGSGAGVAGRRSAVLPHAWPCDCPRGGSVHRSFAVVPPRCIAIHGTQPDVRHIRLPRSGSAPSSSVLALTCCACFPSPADGPGTRRRDRMRPGRAVPPPTTWPGSTSGPRSGTPRAG